jgi:hypothetical protein
MSDVHGFASESYGACLVVVSSELDAKSSAVLGDAGLDASVEAAERTSLEV